MKVKINLKIESNILEEEQYKLESIQRAICDVFMVRQDDLLGYNRMAYIVKPRHVLYYMAYLYTPNSMPSLGKRLGRDHTTILYGIHKIQKERLRNKALNLKINETRILAEAYDGEIEDSMRGLQEEIQAMVDKFKMERIKNGLRAKT